MDPVKAWKGSVRVKRRCTIVPGFRNLFTRLSCAPTGGGMVPPLYRRPPMNREKDIATNEDEDDKNSNDIPGSISIKDRVFYDVAALFQFFGSLLTRTQLGTRVPTEEAKLLLSLLIKGHATPKEKIGCGVRYIYTDKHPDYGQKCFMLMRKDGTTVDFSYRKCINNIGGSRDELYSRKSPSSSSNKSQNQSPYHKSSKPKGQKNSTNTLIALCKQILSSSPIGAHVNEAQNRVFFTMISKGHPNAKEKLGSGVEYVFVGEHPEYRTKCFMLKRFDGGIVDFSFKKCITSLLPGDVESLLGRMSATLNTTSDSNNRKAPNIWDEVGETIKDTLEHTPVGVRLEEKAQRMLLEILMKGHPEADQKIGCGVDYIYVDQHPSCQHKSFFLMRKDGTTDDFSFMKCIRKMRKDEILKVKNGLREPVMKIGSIVFETGDQMYWHFSSILNTYPLGGRITEDHSKLLIELLAQGHPNAEKKIGCGVDYIEVQTHETYGQNCFWVVRKDGSSEDFSYRKCVSHILKKKGAEDPRKLMQLRDSARDLTQEKVSQ